MLADGTEVDDRIDDPLGFEDPDHSLAVEVTDAKGVTSWVLLSFTKLGSDCGQWAFTAQPATKNGSLQEWVDDAPFGSAPYAEDMVTCAAPAGASSGTSPGSEGGESGGGSGSGSVPGRPRAAGAWASLGTSRRDAEYTEFVLARQAHLRRIAYAICGDWNRADDVLQTALIKLYVAWPRVCRTDRGGVRPADHECAPTSTSTGVPGGVGRPDSTGASSGARQDPRSRSARRWFDALQELPVMQRTVVVLRHWLDLSVEETAAELGIATGTVKSHTSRGVAALQQVLRRAPDDEAAQPIV